MYSELSAVESAAVPAHQTKIWGVTNSDEWHPDIGIETGKKPVCSKVNWAIPHHVSDQEQEKQTKDSRINEGF